jgi:hypothetical protein
MKAIGCAGFRLVHGSKNKAQASLRFIFMGQHRLKCGGNLQGYIALILNLGKAEEVTGAALAINVFFIQNRKAITCYDQ